MLRVANTNQQCDSNYLIMQRSASLFGGKFAFNEERMWSCVLIFQGHQNSRRDPTRLANVQFYLGLRGSFGNTRKRGHRSKVLRRRSRWWPVQRTQRLAQDIYRGAEEKACDDGADEDVRPA
jgi:hypothetical protein